MHQACSQNFCGKNQEHMAHPSFPAAAREGMNRTHLREALDYLFLATCALCVASGAEMEGAIGRETPAAGVSNRSHCCPDGGAPLLQQNTVNRWIYNAQLIHVWNMLLMFIPVSFLFPFPPSRLFFKTAFNILSVAPKG